MEMSEREKELTRYCSDFCPIYETIREHNRFHKTINCHAEMCEQFAEAYILDLRKQQLKEE